jgi:hypothetical protein
MIDPSQAAAPAAAPQQAAPAICIAPQGDGTFMVYAEGSEPQGEALDIDAAMDQARSMLGSEGAAPDDGKAKAEALFVGGFDGVRSPLNRG